MRGTEWKMNDDDIFLLDEEYDESTSIHSTIISSIIAIIATGVLVWLLFETIRRMQTGDYSLFVILLIIVSGATFIVCSMIMKGNDNNEL
jgi:predicted Na+-dependent transporter